MGAPPKNFAVPTLDYEMVGKLHEYDGFVFGIPTRFGVMSAQMKAFFDMTGSHWMKQSLSGKPAATFVRKYQVKETLPEGVLKAMGAPPKSSDKVIEHSNIEKLG
eukprot:g2549.t1